MSKPVPASAVWALGITQIVGYGSLYYSFSVLAPAIGDRMAHIGAFFTPQKRV